MVGAKFNECTVGATCMLQVLMGPFVDVEQPLIAGGMINVTFQQLFQTQVGRVQEAQSTLCQCAVSLVTQCSHTHVGSAAAAQSVHPVLVFPCVARS